MSNCSIFASAITKQKIPLSKVPLLENVLLRLTAKTGEVPTDTVFTYGLRNPSGNRRRSFTGTEEEDFFIQSFSSGMSGLTIALAGLETIQDMDICNPEYAELARESRIGFEEMTKAILDVRKKISPEVFTNSLRPFFEPKIFVVKHILHQVVLKCL